MKKILLLVLSLHFALHMKAQVADSLSQAADKKAIKTVVENMLTAVGNYDAEALIKLCMPKANVSGTSLKTGKWVSFSMTIDEFLGELESAPNARKYKETVNQWSISVENGQLAIVRAEATLTRNGKPESHNIDYFTLVKEKGVWKIMCAAYTATPIQAQTK